MIIRKPNKEDKKEYPKVKTVLDFESHRQIMITLDDGSGKAPVVLDTDYNLIIGPLHGYTLGKLRYKFLKVILFFLGAGLVEGMIDNNHLNPPIE